MRHNLLFLGKTKEAFIAKGIEEYSARLKHYTSFSISTLRETKKGKQSTSLKEDQGALLLGSVPSGSLIVALDSRGIQFTSEALAKKIEEWELRGIKQVSYLIGGPDGLSAQVTESADLLFSMSKMTFTHDMVRLFLTEQLYRAYTIKAGERYHK
jgi:23S rRNA (pseudouridine1915-N3)-methyltransferase